MAKVRVVINKDVTPKARNIVHGECATFPRYGNNMVCMRLRKYQRDVTIMPVEGVKVEKLNFMNLEDGIIYLVNPWEVCIPVDVEVVAAR